MFFFYHNYLYYDYCYYNYDSHPEVHLLGLGHLTK